MKTTSTIFPKTNPNIYEKNKNMAEYAKELAQLHNWLGFKNKGKSLTAY